jgi:hypothetical protein
VWVEKSVFTAARALRVCVLGSSNLQDLRTALGAWATHLMEGSEITSGGATPGLRNVCEQDPGRLHELAKEIKTLWDEKEARLKGIPTKRSRRQLGLSRDTFDFPNQAPSFVLRNDGLNSGLSGSVSNSVDLEDRE